MNLQSFTRVLLIFTSIALFSESTFAFEIDLSRRRQDINALPIKARVGERSPASERPTIRKVIGSSSPEETVVILNTETGFVPETVQLQVGQRYHIHVVNVNDKKKNLSFIASEFNQHHATYFGKVKNFKVEPTRDGIFHYECPETGDEGRLVVTPKMKRGLASVKEESGK